MGLKVKIGIVVLLFLSLMGIAQEETRVVDSLLSVVVNQEGRDKVETMMELSRAFFDFSFDDCINWGEKAIEEATRFQDEELLAKAFWKIGMRYLNHYEFDLALENYDKALELLISKEDSELLEDVLNYKGRAELLMGEIDSALITYLQDLKVSENLGDELNCADVINNMAYIYRQQDDIDKAMESFMDARHRYEIVFDTLSIAQCDNNISNIYADRQQYDVALSLLRKSIPVFEQFEDEASLAHAYQNIGTIYATGHVNLDSALVYLRKSIACAEMVGDQVTLVEDEIELANILKLLNRNGEAISLYLSALHSSETIGFLNGMLGAYKNLGVYYNETGDFTTSAIYLKRCMDLALEKGNQLYVNAVRPFLIADYAHMGHFAEMKKELGLFTDDYESILNESSLLDEELAQLRDNAAGLLQQYDSQNTQIQTLQTQRNHYRLAFFGLLAIVIFIAVLFTAYKIVRKKRSKV